MKAEKLLKTMIDIILSYVEELKEYKNERGKQFQYGERSAYTECLELLQMWEKAAENGLNFDIESRYPL